MNTVIQQLVEAADAVAANAGYKKLILSYENAFAARYNRKHAISVNSGTSALHTSLLACGIGQGDEVLMPAVTALAVPMSIMLLKAEPVMVDIDFDLCYRMEALTAQISRRTRAVVVVHPFGYAHREMKEIRAMADRFGSCLVEDCSQAHGAHRQGVTVGEWGDVAAFSTAHGKLLSTDGGGIVVTDDPNIAATARRIAHLGKAGDGNDAIGFNYEMSPLQAALGLYRLQILDQTIAERTVRATAIAKQLSVLGVKLICPPPCDNHVYYKLPFLLPMEFGSVADEIQSAVQKERILAHQWTPERFDRRQFYRDYVTSHSIIRSYNDGVLNGTDSILGRLFLFRTDERLAVDSLLDSVDRFGRILESFS